METMLKKQIITLIRDPNLIVMKPDNGYLKVHNVKYLQEIIQQLYNKGVLKDGQMILIQGLLQYIRD